MHFHADLTKAFLGFEQFVTNMNKSHKTSHKQLLESGHVEPWLLDNEGILCFVVRCLEGLG